MQSLRGNSSGQLAAVLASARLPSASEFSFTSQDAEQMTVGLVN
jgi:hypothetical protein